MVPQSAKNRPIWSHCLLPTTYHAAAAPFNGINISWSLLQTEEIGSVLVERSPKKRESRLKEAPEIVYIAIMMIAFWESLQ